MFINLLIPDLSCIHCSQVLTHESDNLLKHSLECFRASRLDQSYKYICFGCTLHTTNKRDMRHHIRSHTGEKPYTCSFCDFQTSRKPDLQLHIRRHTGVKPFKCSLCDYSSVSNSNLRRHEIKIHNKFTNKVFPVTGDLNRA
uniref:RE1-silencing transcription factor n=1 Tax=Cacopsylla melanoneura TaxID=428564 RepID=A0A8D9BTJ3_9HEMI